jgi:hypothetical protein
VNTEVFFEKPMGRDQWEDLGVYGRILFKIVFTEIVCEVLSGFIRLRIGSSNTLF